MARYYVNEEEYDIPDDVREKFEAENPGASVLINDGEGNDYKLPVAEEPKFKERFPGWLYSADANAQEKAQLPSEVAKSNGLNERPKASVEDAEYTRQVIKDKEGVDVWDQLPQTYKDTHKGKSEDEVLTEWFNADDEEQMKHLSNGDRRVPETYRRAKQFESRLNSGSMEQPSETEVTQAWLDEDNDTKSKAERNQYNEDYNSRAYEYVERETPVVVNPMTGTYVSGGEKVKEKQKRRWTAEDAAEWLNTARETYGVNPMEEVPVSFRGQYKDADEQTLLMKWHNAPDQKRWQARDVADAYEQNTHIKEVKKRAVQAEREALRQEDQSMQYWNPTAGAAAIGAAKASNAARRISYQTENAIEQTDKMIKAFNNHWNDEDFFTGAGKGFLDGITDADSWSAINMLGEVSLLDKIADKTEQGEALTQEEEDLLDALAYKMAVEASLADQLGWGYGSGKMTGASLPFMLQMLVSPVSTGGAKAFNKGVMAVGKRAIKKYGGTILKKTLGNGAVQAVKGAGRLVEGAAGLLRHKTALGRIIGGAAHYAKEGAARTATAMTAGTAQTLLFGSDRLAANIESRMQGNQMITNRANEQYDTMLIGKEAEDWLEATLKGGATTISENATEYLGTTLIDDVLGGIGKAFRGTVDDDIIMQALAAAKKTKAGRALFAISRSKGGRFVDAVAGKTQYNGLFQEYLEEVVNNGVNVMTGDMSAEDFLSAKKNAETILGLSWTSGFFGVAGGAARVKAYAKMQERVNRLDAYAQNAFQGVDAEGNPLIDKWNRIKAELAEMTYDELCQAQQDFIEAIESATPDQRQGNAQRAGVVNEYFRLQAEMLGLKAADDERSGEQSEEEQETEGALGEGMTATPEQQKSITRDLRVTEAVLAGQTGMAADAFLAQYGETPAQQLAGIRQSDLPIAQRQMAERYLMLNQQYQGITEVGEAEIQDAVRQAEKAVDAITNDKTGNVTYVRMTDGMEGHIIRGDVNNDHTLYIQYYDGTGESVSRTNVMEILSDNAAEDVKAVDVEEATAKAIDAVVARLQDHVPSAAEMQMAPGQRVVVGEEAGSLVGIEGNVATVKMDNGKEAKNIPLNDVLDEASYNAVTQAQLEAEAKVQQQAMQAQAEEEAKVKAEEQARLKAEEEARKNQSALERIGKDEQGNPLYEQSDDETAYDALVEVLEGDTEMAAQVIAETIEQKEAELQALQNEPVAKGANVHELTANKLQRKQDIAKAQAEIEKWKAIGGVETKRAQDKVATAYEQAVEEERRQRISEHNQEVRSKAKDYAKQAGVSRKQIEYMIDLCDKFGVKANFADFTTTSEDGTGSVTNASISKDANGDAVVTISMAQMALGRATGFVVGHELTHHVKANGTAEEWKALRDMVVETIGEDRFAAITMRTAQAYAQAYSNRSGQDFWNDIEEEVVSDAMGEVFSDERNMRRVLGLPKTIKDYISDLWDKVTGNDVPQDVQRLVEAWTNLAEGKGEMVQGEEKKHSIVGVRGAEALDRAEGTDVRMTNLDVAKEMRKAGKDAQTIWLATGWEMGADGRWRYEVLEDFAYEEPRAKAERLAEEKEEAENEKEKIYRLLDRFPARGLTDAQKAKKAVSNKVASLPTEEGEQALFSISTYEQQGREILEAYVMDQVSKGKLTQKQGDDIIAEMEDIYNICVGLKDKYAPFGNWSEAEVVVDEQGKPVFSVIKANGDYAMNLDFSLVCKKRRTLDAVFREMIDRGIINNYELGQVDLAVINDIIRKHGFETACRLCFVDAKRFRVAQVADVFCEMYNPLAKMSDAELKKVSKKEGNNTVGKIARMLLKHPENRVELSRANFMDSKGFEDMTVNAEEIMKLYNAKKGTGGPKASYGDTQYMNDILGKQWSAEAAYEVGGVRLQSFSDYVPRMVFDYMQMVADLSAKGLPVHAYTKEPTFAKQFGKTGIKINLSLVPRVDADGVAPGLDANGEYVWQEGETFPYEEAIAIQNAEGYKENCGTIAVGVSDMHIEKLLGDDNIRMVIPYHKSGLNKQVAIHNNIDQFQDYTNEQNTRNADGTKLSKAQMKDHFNFNADLHKHGNPKLAAQNYLDWCDEMGYLPKFDQFREHPNYYKLLEDFTTCITENGVDTYVPQGPVTMAFPTENDAFGSIAQLIEEGLEEDAVLEGNRQADLKNIVDDIQKEFEKGKSMFSITPEYKQKQLEVIKQSNPAEDDYHTWIRSEGDIKSFEEALYENDDYKGEDFDPSYTWDMAEDALQSGEITVYSSKPIANGAFVTPSKMEAESYAGDGRIYTATLPLQDIAWIDPTQGQVAKVEGDVMFSGENNDIRYSFAQQNIEEVNATYNRRLKELDADRKQKDRVLRLGRPSAFLLEGGIIDAPIEMEFDRFVRKSGENYVNDHPFAADDILDLPKAVHSPIAVMESENGIDHIVVTELKKNDRNFIVILQTKAVNRKGRVKIWVNKIGTLFPKHAKGLVWWLINRHDTKIDKEKALLMLEEFRTHFGPELSTEELDYAVKVVKNPDTPPYKSYQSSQSPQNVTPTEQNGDEKFSLRFKNGLDWDGLHDAIQEHTDYSNGAYSLLAKLEEEYGGEIIGASSGARLAIENDGLVPSSKGPGENMEYHHIAFLDKDGNEFVKAVPFVKPETVAEKTGIRFSLAPIAKRQSGESLLDYARRVEQELQQQRFYMRHANRDILARRAYEDRVASGWYQTQEAMQDSMLGLKVLMQSVAGNGTYIEDIPGWENPYLGENRLSSVNKAEVDAFARLMIRPMVAAIDALAKTDEERDELTDYAFAKHGLERNIVMAMNKAQEVFDAQTPGDPNNKSLLSLISIYRQQDFAGLTALTGEKNVADAEAAAKDMVDAYEDSHDATDVQNLWDKVKAVSDAILLKQKESGLMSEKTYQKVSKMYDYYIPLRGFDETTSEDVYNYLNVSSGSGGGFVRAKGRKSKADNPWAYLQSMAEAAITQGNRNVLVKQRLLNFVEHRPSDVASINDIWIMYNPATKTWELAMPEILDGDSDAEIARKWEEFNENMEQLQKEHPKLYKRGAQAQAIPYRVVSDKQLKEHQVLVKTADGDKIITINGSPRAAQAVNGKTNPDFGEGLGKTIFKAGEWANRKLSEVYTSKNPDFVLANWIRDSIFANTMAWIKEDPAYAAKLNANWAKYNPAKLGMLLKKYEDDSLDMNNTDEALFYDFMMNGGETGYSNIRSIEDHKSEIKKELDKLSKSLPNRTKNTIAMLLDKAENIGRAVENAARFATYVTSIESGRGIERAIYDAKEISVNFNKKGSGATFLDPDDGLTVGNVASFVSGFGRAAYVFWNAALQGTTNFGRQMKRHPAKAISALAFWTTLGFLQGMLGTWDDDDDELITEDGEKKLAYIDIPAYVRRNNLIIGGGAYRSMTPLPIEYRAVFGMGELMASLLSGKEHMTPGEIAMAIAEQFANIMPIDMTADHSLVPSALSPIVQVATNRSYLGTPIWYEPENKERGEAMPEWAKAYKGTNQQLVAATRWLSDATGGNAYKGGVIDINPAAIETLMNGYMGGLYTMFSNTIKTSEMMFGDREFDPRYVPLMRRVVTGPNEHTASSVLKQELRKYQEEYEEMKLLLRDYEKDRENAFEDNEELRESLIREIEENPVFEVFEDYYEELKAIRQDKYSDDEETAKAASREELEVMKKMLLRLREIGGGDENEDEDENENVDQSADAGQAATAEQAAPVVPIKRKKVKRRKIKREKS